MILTYSYFKECINVLRKIVYKIQKGIKNFRIYYLIAMDSRDINQIYI